MNSIRAQILSTLRNDSTLQGLLGASGRIFHRFPPSEVDVSAALPGYLCYALDIQGPRSGDRGHAEQEGDAHLSIDIFALTSTKAWAIKVRIHVLLGNKSIRTTDYAVLTCTETSFNDLGIDPAKKCNHSNVGYNLAGVFAKA